jgi:histone H3/H4
MKTYLEFQKEIQELIEEIVMDTISESMKAIPLVEIGRLAKKISTESAQKIAYMVHHEIYPLAPEPEDQWAIE